MSCTTKITYEIFVAIEKQIAAQQNPILTALLHDTQKGFLEKCNKLHICDDCAHIYKDESSKFLSMLSINKPDVSVEQSPGPTKRKEPTDCFSSESIIRYTPNILQIPQGFNEEELDNFYNEWHEVRVRRNNDRKKLYKK